MSDYKNLYDLVIVGAGPAGLTAAIYMARARYKTLVLEKQSVGGQIVITEDVVNYPGVKKTTGRALTQDMAAQAKSFGAEIRDEEVIDLDFSGDIKKVITKKNTYEALNVIIATGANPRKVGFKGEEEFQGRGVAYCATCDGEFFTGMDIFVVGGGFAACEEAMFLTRYANKVKMLVRGEEFRVAQSIAEEVLNHPKIEVYFNTEVESVEGETFPNKLKYKDKKTGETSVYEPGELGTFGTFVFAGYVPNTELVKDKVELDQYGYVVTDMNQMTNVEGVFAAGDLCVKNLRQVVTATADGAIAATSAEKYAQSMHKKLGIPQLFDSKTIVKEEPVQEKATSQTTDGAIITGEMKAQLENLFSRFGKKLTAVFRYNSTDAGRELEQYAKELKGIHENLETEAEKIADDETVNVILKDGDKVLGYQYMGVPGGHEFTSFVLSLYNYSGTGQPLEESQIERINNIKTPLSVNVVVSLTCTQCPELVSNMSQIAGRVPDIKFTVSEIGHAKHLKDKYNIMSVPCMILNEKDVAFGKKSVDEILDVIEK